MVEDQALTPAQPPQKAERPRDELGRPLPQGSVNRLHLQAFETLDLETNHRLAVGHLGAGQAFGAHEAWESCWRLTRGTADEEFFQGLSQIGAGYTHALRGNAHGAQALLRRGAARVARYAPRHYGLELGPLLEAVWRHADLFAEDEAAGRPPAAVVMSQLVLESDVGA